MTYNEQSAGCTAGNFHPEKAPTNSSVFPRLFSGVFLVSATLGALPASSLASDSVDLLDGQLQIGISTTATRSERSLDDTPAAVSVITRQQIEALQAQHISDILQYQPGINLSSTGNAGNTTSVLLRGAEADQVLVLIDGVRVSSSTTGQFDWSQMPLAHIERIEIVRGPRAALYGSDAIGGIIQIFTRKSHQPHAAVSAGRYNTQKVNGGFSVGDRTRLSLNALLERTDGFSSQNSKGSTFHPDSDPYDKHGATLALTHRINPDIQLGVHSFYNRNKADYDQGNTDSELLTGKVHLDARISTNWSQKLNLSYTRDDVYSRYESAFGSGDSRFVTHRRSLDWQNDLTLSPDSTLILGASYREDHGNSADYNESISNRAVFAHLNKRQGKLNLDLSTRYDHHNRAGGELTGQLAGAYQIRPNTRIYASLGTAFKAPSINELFYPGFFGSFAGNPDLKAETSRTVEAGFKTRLGSSQQIEASLYRMEVENLITYSGTDNQAINSDRANFTGLELDYKGNLDLRGDRKFDWGLNLTLQKTEDEQSGERLLRRPDRKAGARIGYTLANNTRLGLDLSLTSSRDDNNFAVFPSERVTLDDYALVNFSLTRPLTRHAHVGLRLENITDENYEKAYGYNSPGRSAYITFSYK